MITIIYWSYITYLLGDIRLFNIWGILVFSYFFLLTIIYDIYLFAEFIKLLKR
jgi:hypothetical protein